MFGLSALRQKAGKTGGLTLCLPHPFKNHSPEMRSRMSDLHRYSLILVLIFTALGLPPTRPAGAAEQNALAFERFDLLSETSGWVLAGRQLLWTSDLGR